MFAFTLFTFVWMFANHKNMLSLEIWKHDFERKPSGQDNKTNL